MKGVVFKEAIEFVKHLAQDITTVLSKQHRNVVKTFMNYRIFSDRMIDERNFLYERWRMFEEAYC